MPLRDHFRPPVEARHSWDELHGMWPGEIVRQLFPILPEGYVAAPRVHLGAAFEIDVSTFRETEPVTQSQPPRDQGGVAVVPWAPPRPTFTLEADLAEPDEYEVRVYDARFERRLVAAIEVVSPSNKDRPESRRAFVAKAEALLRRGVCISMVDVVTIRRFNLYADLLESLDGSDPMVGESPPAIYAVTARGRRPTGGAPLLETWFSPIELGRPLPTLPIWLEDGLAVSLDLEASYEEACRLLRIA
ncbi:hypothetical protein OJF2_66790 [Aquisphaera giovannonii]|uniref:DUF4058 domain-containing protein n=1 Tax=Aquisphaera giovannonii TaxID=406548 RepID=A0A5B9WDP3_9BACT|nr:DUF4058 family protein [Aquisphaera giovannonii]QEH38081.1 hypothetical protein OJF2_66790 [Aquisphaera giovannonii]